MNDLQPDLDNYSRIWTIQSDSDNIMKSLVTHQQVAKFSWPVVTHRVIRADQPVLKTDPNPHLDAIIDAIHEPVLILHTDLTIQSANKAFFQNFKTTRKKIVTRKLTDLGNHTAQIQKLVRRLKKLSRSNASFEELELTASFGKTGERMLLINAKQIAYDNKQSDILLLSIEDITQRRLVERQKDDFVGYVTHELKTPITTLSAFLQLLQGYHEKTGDKKSQYLLAKVSGQLDRLTNLLQSFSQVYKAQTGMLQLHKEKIDLYELVRETVEMFQYTTTTHTISIEGNITKPIMIDKERVRQVVINLLINAIKYSQNADTIFVKFSEEPKNLVVSVQDFGPGIPQAAQERIFERFFRMKENQSYNVKGLGLGLYIALEIIKAHKGKLWVESTEGKGATFSFSLPVTQ
jgi:two-component system, chemotaxis family, CheB/CheR fusion protein